MSKGATSTLVKLGLIQMKKEPRAAVVTYKRVFYNPNTGQTVTLLPIPTVARPEYWQNNYYGLHNRFDKILYEDGWGPVPPGGLSAAAKFRKIIFPIAPHTEEVDDPARAKYVGKQSRDIVESSMAFQSVMEQMTPPVDPRARRGVEHLLTIDPREKVVMPWNINHMYYLQYRLKELGFTEYSTEEVIMIYQLEGFILTLTAMLFVIGLPCYFIIKFVLSFF
eukprot:PhF_6_TR19725/c0_g1_i1/m.28791